jgi:hypothetical protein
MGRRGLELGFCALLQAQHQSISKEREERELEGSFPPAALGFSSFLWGYMG